MNASNTSILPEGNVWPAKSTSSSLAPTRLLVMSNRAPIRIVREDGHDRIVPTVGGVGTTFLSLLERHGGLWIAWSGTQARKSRVTIPLQKGARLELVFQHLSERDMASYYYGMCNHALWPLMHYMTLNTRFDRTDWDSYCRVNLSFARTALAEASVTTLPGSRTFTSLWFLVFFGSGALSFQSGCSGMSRGHPNRSSASYRGVAIF